MKKTIDFKEKRNTAIDYLLGRVDDGKPCGQRCDRVYLKEYRYLIVSDGDYDLYAFDTESGFEEDEDGNIIDNADESTHIIAEISDVPSGWEINAEGWARDWEELYAGQLINYCSGNERYPDICKLDYYTLKNKMGNH